MPPNGGARQAASCATLVAEFPLQPTYSAREAAALLGKSYSWLDQRVRTDRLVLLVSVCGFTRCLAVPLQDILDVSDLGLLDALAAGIGLEDGDVAVGPSGMGAEFGAVEQSAKDGVLDGNSHRLPVVTASNA